MAHTLTASFCQFVENIHSSLLSVFPITTKSTKIALIALRQTQKDKKNIHQMLSNDSYIKCLC